MFGQPSSWPSRGTGGATTAVSDQPAIGGDRLQGAVAAAVPVPWFLARSSDGVILQVNRYLQDLLGAQAENMLGRAWTELCFDADEQAGLAAALADGGSVDGYELQLKSSDNTPLWVSASVEPVQFDSDAQLSFVVLDIEDRRALEDTLAESAAELTEMAAFPEMNPGAVLRVDRRGTVVLANSAARSVFDGMRLEGNSWLELCPTMDQDIWDTVLGTSESVAIEAQIGERSLVFTHSHGADDRYVFVYGTDLTDQRSAERALQQSERMATLGTLAAGLAHELNNPAAAARRATQQLREAFPKLSQAERSIAQLALTGLQSKAMTEVDEQARERAGGPIDLNPTTRSDREQELEDLLDGFGLEDSWQISPGLVDLGYNAERIERLAETFNPEQLECVLVWLSRRYEVHSLMGEIGHGAERVAEIVTAMRSYTYLDQAPVQNVNLHEGLDNTLIILTNKLKVGVTVRREYADDLPNIEAYGSELNQIWTNLIDNAIYAMDGRGEITLRTFQRDEHVVIEVEDNGSGIPAGVQGRIFDPFFTTKAPGDGTGLGLNTTFNIVQKHGGRIEVESEPGRTRFTVELPLTLKREA